MHSSSNEGHWIRTSPVQQTSKDQTEFNKLPAKRPCSFKSTDDHHRRAVIFFGHLLKLRTCKYSNTRITISVSCRRDLNRGYNTLYVSNQTFIIKYFNSTNSIQWTLFESYHSHYINWFNSKIDQNYKVKLLNQSKISLQYSSQNLCIQHHKKSPAAAGMIRRKSEI